MMDAKTYVKISAINLIFLLFGIMIGVAFTTELSGVHAQTKQAQTVDSSPTRDVASVKVTLDPNAEYVLPAVTLGGPVVTNTILANRVACDRLQVNGYDVLQLNDAILKLLEKQGATQADLRAVIQAGKAEHALRIKPQP